MVDLLIQPEIIGFIDVFIGLVIVWILFSINRRFASGEFKKFVTWLLIMINISLIRLAFVSANELFQITDVDTRFYISLILAGLSLLAGLKAALTLKDFARVYGQMDIEKFVKPYRTQKLRD